MTHTHPYPLHASMAVIYKWDIHVCNYRSEISLGNSNIYYQLTSVYDIESLLFEKAAYEIP